MFDRFASLVARWTAKPWFFAVCVGIVVVWAPSFFVFGNVDTWQLVINTTTTIITFLLVALFQNTQERFERKSKESDRLQRLALAELLYAEADRAEEVPGYKYRLRRLADQLKEGQQ